MNSTTIESTYREEQLSEAAGATHAFASHTERANLYSAQANALHAAHKKGADYTPVGKAHEKAADSHRAALYAHSDKISRLSQGNEASWSEKSVAALHHHVDASAHHSTQLSHHWKHIYKSK
jgi:hypothetical protein